MTIVTNMHDRFEFLISSVSSARKGGSLRLHKLSYLLRVLVEFQTSQGCANYHNIPETESILKIAVTPCISNHVEGDSIRKGPLQLQIV